VIWAVAAAPDNAKPSRDANNETLLVLYPFMFAINLKLDGIYDLVFRLADNRLFSVKQNKNL
jgi:hypothetical protein